VDTDTPPHVDAEPPVEPEHLRTLRDAYGEVATHVLELFERTATDTIGELGAAIESGDGEAARRLAHRLTGSARNVGAVRMADLAAALEASYEPRAAFERLAAALAPTCAALRAALEA
jgi:two-component system sensor histidine kinase/response regulator